MSGRDVKGYLDGTVYLEHTLFEPVSGHVGVHLDDYMVVSVTP